MPLISIIQQESNARIQPTGRHRTKPSGYWMKDKLFPVGCNELLDFVRRDHSASPDLSTLILLVNEPIAVWRLIFDYDQYPMLARAQRIQARLTHKNYYAAHDSRRLIQAFALYQSTGI